MDQLIIDDLMISFDEVGSLVRGKRIALVGNAESLRSTRLGPSIDRHDLVVRFNQGLPDPSRSEAIGARMDVWAGVIVPRQKLVRVQRGPDTAVPQPERFVDLGIRWNRDVSQIWIIPIGSKWVLHADLLDKAWAGDEAMAEARHDLGTSPTTGFIVARMLALSTCCAEIALYGFDFFRSRSWPSRKTGQGHDPRREEEWLDAHGFVGRPLRLRRSRSV